VSSDRLLELPRLEKGCWAWENKTKKIEIGVATHPFSVTPTFTREMAIFEEQ